MSYPIDTLKPAVVWSYFDRIRQIPRGSGNEQGLAEAIVSWAEDRGCGAAIDAAGNIRVRIPASEGCENVPVMVLQGHLDMVCEKSADKEFDFEKDPIVLVRDDDWITADGTTLGADNGIGLAVGLSFMDRQDLRHGPIEILGTVEEETGLFGAQKLALDFVKGRLLFNLDSEEDGVFYVGCAGGCDIDVTLPAERVPAPLGLRSLSIRVSGLRGGHSGLDIIRNRANALVLTARLLNVLDRETNLSLSSIFGGDKHNAIPREAEATFLCPAADEEKMRYALAGMADGFQDEFAAEEPDLTVAVELTEAPSSIFTPDAQTRLINLLLGLPNGVLSMMRDVPGVVETSNNLAKVRTGTDNVHVLLSARSSVKSAIEGVTSQIEAVSTLALAKAKVLGGYPGWKPNMSSELLARSKRLWKETHGTAPEVHVVHAGLECGLLSEKYPEMDMISLGPTIENAHSPKERVSISSVARFYDFAVALVTSLAAD